MANTNFLQFDANGSNMLSDEDYASDTQRQSGVVSGIARSTLHNKQAFQASTMVKALADVMVEGGQNVMDNNLVALKQAIKASFITAWKDNIFTGNNTFSGSIDLGSSATATTPSATDNSTKVATTEWIKNASQSGDLGIPNYGARVSFSTESYTPTSNGIIVVKAHANSPSAQIAVHNGSFIISRAKMTGDATNVVVWAVVHNGEAYDTSGSGTVTRWFIPFR